MKIRCSCGTKYEFDVTADMLANPIRFVCSNCGEDQSESVNQLIQQEFGAGAAQAAPPEPAPAPGPRRLQVKLHTTAAAPAAAPEEPPAAAPQRCRKHPGQLAAEYCRVCRKPLCPVCMTVFGYVCSAFCKHQAEERGIDVPVYAGQTHVAQNARLRRAGRPIFIAIGAVALVIAVWAFYAFVASKPRVVMSASFSTPAFSGAGKLLGRDTILLHGGHLTRIDWKSKKEIWAVDLIDTNQLAKRTEDELASDEAALAEWKKKRTGDDLGTAWHRRSREEIYVGLLAAAQSEFALHARDSNIWLRTENKLVQYDWSTGKPSREVALKGRVERTLLAHDAVLVFSDTDEGEELTRINLSSGETQTQQLQVHPKLVPGLGKSNRLASAALDKTNRAASSANASAKTNAIAAARGTPANPALKGYKVAQPDPLANRIAAPAIVAAGIRNAQIEKQLEDDAPAAVRGFDSSRRQFINDHGQLVEFSVKLLESKTIERQAMKPPPKKSALDGEVNQAATMAIANELVNEWQRELTGGVEHEDASRYEVTIKRAGADAPGFKAEVVGPPQFFALESVDLLVAGQTLTVLDKSGRKLWESKLNFGIATGFSEDDWGELIATATAPGVERDGRLYFFDQGVLSCFDLKTGNAIWRQPTVGVTKLLFDERGGLYADTTTGSVESLKYSQQMDLSDKNYPVILKLDAKTGKTLWRSERNGRLSHVFGKFIYTVEWHGGDEDAAPSPYKLGVEIPPHIRLRRLSARTGVPEWEYYQKRAPLNLDIQQNTIELVFKKELQILKFFSL